MSNLYRLFFLLTNHLFISKPLSIGEKCSYVPRRRTRDVVFRKSVTGRDVATIRAACARSSSSRTMCIGYIIHRYVYYFIWTQTLNSDCA